MPILNTQTVLTLLPDELLLKIFKLLDICDQAALGRVCKLLYRISNDTSVSIPRKMLQEFYQLLKRTQQVKHLIMQDHPLDIHFYRQLGTLRPADFRLQQLNVKPSLLTLLLTFCLSILVLSFSNYQQTRYFQPLAGNYLTCIRDTLYSLPSMNLIQGFALHSLLPTVVVFVVTLVYAKKNHQMLESYQTLMSKLKNYIFSPYSRGAKQNHAIALSHLRIKEKELSTLIEFIKKNVHLLSLQYNQYREEGKHKLQYQESPLKYSRFFKRPLKEKDLVRKLLHLYLQYNPQVQSED